MANFTRNKSGKPTLKQVELLILAGAVRASANWYHFLHWINNSTHAQHGHVTWSPETLAMKDKFIASADIQTAKRLHTVNEFLGCMYFMLNEDRIFLLSVATYLLNQQENSMSLPTVESKIPPEKMEQITSEIAHMRKALDERIPEFSIQLQSILGQLQATPEATWALTDEQRKTIVDAFKQNVNITCFQSEKGGSVKGHKIPAGPLTPDMF